MVADPPPAETPVVPLDAPPPATPTGPTPLRFLSYLLGALAVGVLGLAYLAFGFARNMACGYARSACSRVWPWGLTGDDFDTFVLWPGLVALALLWGAVVSYRRSR
ncbi:hypothetical protein ACBY01_05810 [Sphingomonas sp. ac-8]|uniref:hypothetical protein n=1 Tax=Sphingomonas sp. ac-8 TaxID=3242977 RepID=UPI003A800D02